METLVHSERQTFAACFACTSFRRGPGNAALWPLLENYDCLMEWTQHLFPNKDGSFRSAHRICNSLVGVSMALFMSLQTALCTLAAQSTVASITISVRDSWGMSKVGSWDLEVLISFAQPSRFVFQTQVCLHTMQVDLFFYINCSKLTSCRN